MVSKKEYDHQYYENHKDERKKWRKDYHQKHKEEENLRQKMYNKSHKKERTENQKLNRKDPQKMKKQYDNNKKWRKELKLEIFIHYGGNAPKCACCGEPIYEFLTLDHINNDGGKHRKELNPKKQSSTTYYVWIKQNNYPEGYQILCMNCNFGKRMNNGICPHKIQEYMDKMVNKDESKI